MNRDRTIDSEYETWAGIPHPPMCDAETPWCAECGHEIDADGACGCVTCTQCKRKPAEGCEDCKIHCWLDAWQSGEMELAAEWFGEMSEVEQLAAKEEANGKVS